MDKNKADEYLKTLASAYVWIASIDEGVSLVEFSKYEHVMVQSQFATQFDPVDIRHYFKDMVSLFIDDYEKAVELTLMRLKEFKGQEHLAQEVLRICRAAIVSDGVIKKSEEIILTKICQQMAV